jgi:hypothetical protein
MPDGQAGRLAGWLRYVMIIRMRRGATSAHTGRSSVLARTAAVPGMMTAIRSSLKDDGRLEASVTRLCGPAACLMIRPNQVSPRSRRWLTDARSGGA